MPQKVKILIVDDSIEVRQIVKATLGTESYIIHEASTGEEAIEKALIIKPNVVLMDIVMPGGGIDGVQATRILKENPLTQSSKIIILSGTFKERCEEGILAGADEILVKPFSPLDLIEKVELLSLKQKEGSFFVNNIFTNSYN